MTHGGQEWIEVVDHQEQLLTIMQVASSSIYAEVCTDTDSNSHHVM